jgi:ribosomal protein L11 methylase PrmA
MTPEIDLGTRSSFRDPSGFLFTREGALYRQVNRSYGADYDLFLSSGLYDRLVKKNLLISHQEVDQPAPRPELSYKIIAPERVDFISYPYEWGFSQYKDAALVTLRIQKLALQAGMSLKDASAYNIQFQRGKMLLIDTLSFEKYEEGKPWVAYRQFCQHFLAPLSLMAFKDIRCGQWMRVYIDGLPLDLTSKLLPWQTRLNMGLAMHIHAHAAAQQKYSAGGTISKVPNFSKNAMLGLIENLESTIRKLLWKQSQTEWGDYYNQTNYSDQGLQQKEQVVSGLIQQIQPAAVWDLGGNTGRFCRNVTAQGIPAIAFDIDPAAVENGYLESRSRKDAHLQHLLLDLTNPSPAIGWSNQERMSLSERGPVDVVMALALIHHLAISNNVPLERVAEYLSGLGRWLIIEFVPKTDSQVQRLLQTRLDIFPEYTAEGFEKAFGKFYRIQQVIPIPETQRTIYLMEKTREFQVGQ